ncbi:MAG: efflux RND transporter periplasmic adaptor subunit [Bacteroidota bacterium]
MKKYLYITPLILLLAACGGQAPQTLEGKKAALQQKKVELRSLNQEITQLEEEIRKLDPAAKAEIRKATVGVMPLETETFAHYVTQQGRVEADNNIMVSPMMAGRVMQIYVKEGQYVKRGQTLAQLDDAVMKSTISEVQTSLNLANTLYEKQKNLWEQEIGTEIQYLTAKNQKEALEQRLKTLEEQRSLTKITAPINGSIDEIVPKMGEMVSPGFPAFRVVNSGSLSLKANVSESYIPYINRGEKVKVSFPTIDREMNAKVSMVGQSIDANNRTFKVEVKLPNDPLIKANMFGEISINDRTEKDAIAIPFNIIQQGEEGQYVFVAKDMGEGKWKAERVDIERGLDYEGKVVVNKGLKKGDLLISAGFRDLSDGQEIEFDPSVLAKEVASE